MNNTALGRTIPLRQNRHSFGGRLLPWARTRPVTHPPVGLFGAMSGDGVMHASVAIAREWTAARARMGGLS